jgi:hypothetical protein
MRTGLLLKKTVEQAAVRADRCVGFAACGGADSQLAA